jgi:peptidoglycan hydrolase CwlO-like protein
MEIIAMKTAKLITITTLLFAISLTVRAQTTNKVVAAKNYTEQQVQEFDKKADREFHKLGKQLDDLKAQAKTQSGDAKAALDQKIAQAQQKIDDLKPKLTELKTATTNAWSDVKTGFERGLDDLRNALK